MGFELTTLVVIGTDYTDSSKYNYHTTTTMKAPVRSSTQGHNLINHCDKQYKFNTQIDQIVLPL